MTPDDAKQYRLLIGMTQAQFAELLGVCRKTVTRIEKGHTKIETFSDRIKNRVDEYLKRE